MYRILSLSLILLFTSCGYQILSLDTVDGENRIISVPYIEGDTDGALTAAVIKQLVKSGRFCYREEGAAKEGAEFELLVKIVNVVEDEIGFRYDRKKRGQLRKEIIPTEMRATLIVEVTLCDKCKGLNLVGPVQLSCNVEFDHDYYFSRNRVNVFSLGQLTNIDAATDAMYVPLYEAMAVKIVDYLLLR